MNTKTIEIILFILGGCCALVGGILGRRGLHPIADTFLGAAGVLLAIGAVVLVTQ